LGTEFEMAEDGVMSSPTPLAALIRNRRVSAGLTQEDLAEKAGISVRTISDIERGLRRSVYRDTAERLADAFDVGDAEKDDFVSVARGQREAYKPPGPHVDRRGEPSAQGHIPLPPTPLVGREREVEILLGAFRDGIIRSITLVGPGGIGKTRLAAEAAVQARHIFRDGVFFVPLSSTDDSARVVPVVGEALGMAEPEALSVADISRHLGPAAILLVLDTFEHVIDAAEAVAELLTLCDHLTLLVTSREPLRIRGEQVVAVPPLGLPPEGSTDLSSWASGRLLLERASAAKADLVIDEESSAVLADICRRLDGLPLAIELAASRVRHLPLMTLRDQLDSRLSVLTRGGADLPRRQRTMRAAIGWSYDQLEAEERSLFRSLSVFAGGWTFEAVEPVRTASEGDVVETLSALVDKSLVVLTGAEGRAARYLMMDVIAEFAAEQRDRCGETPDLFRSHLSYFLSLAESAEEKSGTAAQEDAYAELLAEHENLRTALRWSLTNGDPQIGLRLAAALWQFWRAAGYLSEGRSWLERALRTAGGAPSAARGRALWGACWLAFQQDDIRSARRYSKELLEVTRDDDASLMRRHALTVQAMVHMAKGDHAAALIPLERSAAISEASGSSWYLATSKLNLALGLLHLGRLDHASSLLDDALDLYARLGDQRFMARAHAYQGHLALLRGDKARASELFCQSARRFMDVNDEGGIAEALEGLAAVSAATGSMERAARLLGAARHARERAMSKSLPFERALIDGWLDEARGALGEEAWTDLLGRGGAVDAAEAVALVERD
jgi:predicted ATPase/transcriptional regulator with XRE-family HTH domain